MMNKDIYLYLAGSLTYLLTHNMFYKATRWRNDLDTWALDNGIKTFNPAKVYSVEKNHNYSDKMIVDQNNFFLNKTTIMVVQLEYLDQSPGTIYELALYKAMGKPIIAFGKEKHWSPHVNYCISHHCETEEEVIELLTNMFL